MKGTPRPHRPKRPERVHQRPPDPAEASDRPLEPKSKPSRLTHSRADKPGASGPIDEPPHRRLTNPARDPDPTSDSDPYEDDDE